MLRLVSPTASGAFTQVPTCQAQDEYAQAPLLPVLADQAEGKKVPTGQASGANMQVPTGQAPGAQLPAGHAPGATMHVPAGQQCRPGPKSGVSSWLKILLTANLFTRTHSVRVPALSAGAGGSSTFVYAVSQQVQAEIQSSVGSQVLLTPFVANCQTLPRVNLSQTLRFFRFLQIPDECSAADHRYLVPNADRKLAAATYPILGWGGPHWVRPTYASRCGLDFDARLSKSQLVCARVSKSENAGSCECAEWASSLQLFVAELDLVVIVP